MYINIKEDELLTKDRISEGRMSLSELSEIVEAPTAFYLKTSIAHSLIIPKSALNQPYELKKQLTSIANKFQIPYSNAKNWHWK
ncbi:YcxB family protein [Hymenobacter sp. NBH84]|uniref:YcxB family protein n=1 Tax=Hymenobacter sp. NBH84 TaxID=2596915 RepID=UPI001628173C